MSTTYRFIADPGHAWLEVSLEEIARLGVPVSRYSYRRNGHAYLEEDCDAPRFLNAKKARGESFALEDVYQNPTPIRGYTRF